MNLFDSIQYCQSEDAVPMMMSYFHTSMLNYILFSEFKTTGWLTLLISCLSLFFISIFNQLLYLISRWNASLANKGSRQFSVDEKCYDESDPLGYFDDDLGIQNNNDGGVRIVQKRFLSKIPSWIWYPLKVLAFLIYCGVNYMLMLTVMTYNLYIFLAVVIGTAVGWSIFSMPFNIDPAATCH